jgi:hypothetical protein
MEAESHLSQSGQGVQGLSPSVIHSPRPTFVNTLHHLLSTPGQQYISLPICSLFPTSSSWVSVQPRPKTRSFPHPERTNDPNANPASTTSSPPPARGFPSRPFTPVSTTTRGPPASPKIASPCVAVALRSVSANPTGNGGSSVLMTTQTCVRTRHLRLGWSTRISRSIALKSKYWR